MLNYDQSKETNRKSKAYNDLMTFSEICLFIDNRQEKTYTHNARNPSAC